jgi:hypothetical protein
MQDMDVAIARGLLEQARGVSLAGPVGLLAGGDEPGASGGASIKARRSPGKASARHS